MTVQYYMMKEDEYYSKSEELRLQIKKIKKENPEDPVLEDLYDELEQLNCEEWKHYNGWLTL